MLIQLSTKRLSIGLRKVLLHQLTKIVSCQVRDAAESCTLATQARSAVARTRALQRWPYRRCHTWAKYTSNVESVVTVDQQGIAKVTGSGQAAISAWFASQLVVTPITVPYQQQIASEVFTQSPRANLIDELVIKQLQRLNLPPSPLASDSEFCAGLLSTRLEHYQL